MKIKCFRYTPEDGKPRVLKAKTKKIAFDYWKKFHPNVRLEEIIKTEV